MKRGEFMELRGLPATETERHWYEARAKEKKHAKIAVVVAILLYAIRKIFFSV